MDNMLTNIIIDILMNNKIYNVVITLHNTIESLFITHSPSRHTLASHVHAKCVRQYEAAVL